ncbi:MAG TPA: helix-turn-helix domain-containing protein [Candidatus Sulfotelmatobacter sp.]|nr:helix-turn-helix domain-containing protein [Candidatus Sulfotelmatobacter sp.]
MDQNFKTQQDFLDAVEGAVAKAASDPDIRKAIVAGVSQADDALAEWKDQDNPGQELRLGRWFIRNDDFPFFELLTAVASAVAALAASGGVAAPALIGPISGFVSACWKVRRKGADLTPAQIAILGVLSTNQGITVKHITEKLAAVRRPSTADEVRATLKSLTSLELCDGSQVEIVRCDNEDQWRALRV